MSALARQPWIRSASHGGPAAAPPAWPLTRFGGQIAAAWLLCSASALILIDRLLLPNPVTDFAVAYPAGHQSLQCLIRTVKATFVCIYIAHGKPSVRLA